MDGSLALLISFGALIIMLAANVPVAFALGVSGVAGILLLRDASIAARVLGAEPFEAVSGYSLVVVPMFVLLGMFALRAELARDLFGFANKVLRWLPGGLGLSTIATCAGFAAVTGSSVATVATLGKMAIGEMSRYGYNKYFAAGIVGAGGTLGVLIPPSIVLVIYGIITRESIGMLLIAGIIPGLVSAVAYAMVVIVRIKLNKKLIDAEQSDRVQEYNSDHSESDNKEKTTWAGISALLRISILFVIVIGGIYFGFFTATESGAIAALAGFVFLVVKHRGNIKQIYVLSKDAIKETVALTAMGFTILVGAGIFTYFLVIGKVPSNMANWVVDLDLPPILIVLAMVAALIPLGMFLDTLSIIVISVPLLYPPITALGFDGIWLGIVIVKLIEIGLITPPVGLNAYVVAGTVPGLKLTGVFRGLSPFIIADLAVVALLFAVPEIATWLPNLSRA